METFDAEITQFLLVPAVLVLVAGFVAAILIVQGVSLRISVNLVDAGPIGFLYATFVAIAMSISGCVVSMGMTLVFNDANPWILACYSAVTAVIVLALLVRCHPLKAVFAYLCHLFFGVVGSMLVAFAAIILLVIGASTNAVNFPEIPPEMMDRFNSRWTNETPVHTTGGFKHGVGVGGGSVQANPFTS
jgi:hypothetical protein